jgi:hypothetical protein
VPTPRCRSSRLVPASARCREGAAHLSAALSSSLTAFETPGAWGASLVALMSAIARQCASVVERLSVCAPSIIAPSNPSYPTGYQPISAAPWWTREGR